MAFQLTEPITLLRPSVPVRDERGGQTDSVREELPTLAQLESWSGGERNQGDVSFSYNQRAVTIRRNPDITTSWSVVVDGYELNIKAILPAGTRRATDNFQRLICEAPDTLMAADLAGTGPQPVYVQFQAQDAGDGFTREVFDVTGSTGNVNAQPSQGDAISVASTPGATLAGQYIVLLYPAEWGEPRAVYYGADRGINQIGAFRFIPAEASGSPSDVAANYRAMVSNNRKASDSALALVLVW